MESSNRKISQNKKIVIVGGVAAGASCAARARRLSEDAEILVLERGENISFANCGLPYHIGGEIAVRHKLILQSPQALQHRFRIEARTRHEVTAIDRTTKTITVKDLERNSDYTEAYDDLVLAPGAAPIRPNLPGADRPGLFTLRDLADMDRIIEWIAKHGVKRSVVVGGGYIGLELSEQLSHRGIEIVVIEALSQVMAPLDSEMAELLHRSIRDNGITLELNDRVERFSGEADGDIVVETSRGKAISCQMVVLGIGVRPESKLARDAGLGIGERGGISVNGRLQTSDPHIWAAGDCIEVNDFVTGRPALIPLAGPANRQGRIIADNICGGSSSYGGTQGTAILRLFDLSAATTGANEKTLRQLDRPYRAVHLHPASHASYFPGAQQIALKVLFDPSSGVLLGAQAIGRDGIDKRIDVLATALRARMTVDDLAELELAYAPPFGSAKDPVNLAGMIGQNIRRGLVDTITPAELKSYAEPYLLLDVRDPAERERGSIPGALAIPLNQLRGRLKELPSGKLIVVYCQSGQRSYYACRILRLNNFICRNLSGAFLTWSTALT